MNPYLVEEPVSFPKSKLWQMQRNYFTLRGLEAWKGEVPYYISSNTLIAYQYALLIVNYIRDWRQLKKTTSECFYIVELGSGTGKFSFYFLKALTELLALFDIKEQKFCYLITDVVESNLQFCKENVSFKPFIESKQLDFCHFNIEQDKDFYLQLQQKNYSQLKNDAPLIIIANYVFDCIQQDMFRCQMSKLQAVKLGLTSRYKNFNPEKALHLNDLRFNYEFQEVDFADYSEITTEILKDYHHYFAQQEKETTILMPLGAFRFLDHLMTLNQNFLLISGDKGISLKEKIHLLQLDKSVSYDGCLAFMVNFHAMGEYLKKHAGDYLPTQHGNDFKVNLFTKGASFKELINTQGCFETHLEHTGPDEYCFIFDEYLGSFYRFGMRGLLSFLRLSRWDPHAYAIIHDRFIELAPFVNQQIREDILVDIGKVSANIYRLSVSDDVFNLLGIFYNAQQMPEKALELFNSSIETFGDKSLAHHNLGVLYDKQKNNAKALFHFQKASKTNKKNHYARKRVLQLSGKTYLTFLSPLLKATFVIGLMLLALYVMR